jgi:hypothetical protein
MYTYDDSKRDLYYKVWDILVEHAGASKSSDERESFLSSMTQIEYPTSEYRFQGSLGFGGKLYRGSLGELRISCYPEDRTAKRIDIISRVNTLLKSLLTSV